MQKQIIATDKAPAAVGPYSQAVKVGPFLYTSGQIAIDPATNEFQREDVAGQTEWALKNLTAVLHEAGGSLANIIKVTVFLRYMKDYAEVNTVYARYFGDNPPARSAVAVAALPLSALVEIEAVAYIPQTDHEPISPQTDEETDDSTPKTTSEDKPKKKKKKNKKKKNKKE